MEYSLWAVLLALVIFRLSMPAEVYAERKLVTPDGFRPLTPEKITAETEARKKEEALRQNQAVPVEKDVNSGRVDAPASGRTQYDPGNPSLSEGANRDRSHQSGESSSRPLEDATQRFRFGSSDANYSKKVLDKVLELKHGGTFAKIIQGFVEAGLIRSQAAQKTFQQLLEGFAKDFIKTNGEDVPIDKVKAALSEAADVMRAILQNRALGTPAEAMRFMKNALAVYGLQKLAPGKTEHLITVVKQLLDFLTANPARSKSFKAYQHLIETLALMREQGKFTDKDITENLGELAKIMGKHVTEAQLRFFLCNCVLSCRGS